MPGVNFKNSIILPPPLPTPFTRDCATYVRSTCFEPYVPFARGWGVFKKVEVQDQASPSANKTVKAGHEETATVRAAPPSRKPSHRVPMIPSITSLVISPHSSRLSYT